MTGDRPSRRQCLHLLEEITLPLKPDARQIRHDNVPVLHAHAIWESAIGLEQVRIAFIATQSEPRRDVQRHLVPAMRNADRKSTRLNSSHLGISYAVFCLKKKIKKNKEKTQQKIDRERDRIR